MTPFSALATSDTKVRIALLVVENGKPGCGLNLAGLQTPLHLAQHRLPTGSFELTVHRIGLAESEWLKLTLRDVHVALLVGDELDTPPTVQQSLQLAQLCQQARFWGGVGRAVLWLACAGALARTRAALPWAMYPEINELAEQAILVPNLFELDGRCLTCCGGTVSVDFAMTLIQTLFGAELQADVMEALCVDKLRSGDERQRIALHTRFGVLQPQLSEAVTLMENNIEETLSTDDIAQLVGLSRRQLERQFKQYLGSMPSRYYLELRLKKARQLLLESNSSIVQIGLMCGFSSGAHFSTAFSAQFGITPREERQRKLSSG